MDHSEKLAFEFRKQNLIKKLQKKETKKTRQ